LRKTRDAVLLAPANLPERRVEVCDEVTLTAASA
jgi:hypothetical protein